MFQWPQKWLGNYRGTKFTFDPELDCSARQQTRLSVAILATLAAESLGVSHRSGLRQVCYSFLTRNGYLTQLPYGGEHHAGAQSITIRTLPRAAGRVARVPSHRGEWRNFTTSRFRSR
jgi:hypothetical protein